MLLILRNPIETALNKKSLSLGYGAVYWTFFFRPVTGSSPVVSHLPEVVRRVRWEGGKWVRERLLLVLPITHCSLHARFEDDWERVRTAIFFLISSTYNYSFMKDIRLHFSKMSPQYLHSYPLNFQAQYRLGSCLSACKRYSEALEPFSRSLQLLLDNPSSTEHDKVDTLNHVLSVALKHPGTSTFISFIHINAKQYFKEQRYH